MLIIITVANLIISLTAVNRDRVAFVFNGVITVTTVDCDFITGFTKSFVRILMKYWIETYAAAVSDAVVTRVAIDFNRFAQKVVNTVVTGTAVDCDIFADLF